MNENIKKRCASTHDILIEGLEFDLDLPKGSSIIGCFFRVVDDTTIDLISGKRKQRMIPTLVADSDPDADVIPHRFAFVQVDTIVGIIDGNEWKVIGCYPSPIGLMALYNVYSKD